MAFNVKKALGVGASTFGSSTLSTGNPKLGLAAALISAIPAGLSGEPEFDSSIHERLLDRIGSRELSNAKKASAEVSSLLGSDAARRGISGPLTLGLKGATSRNIYAQALENISRQTAPIEKEIADTTLYNERLKDNENAELLNDLATQPALLADKLGNPSISDGAGIRKVRDLLGLENAKTIEDILKGDADNPNLIDILGETVDKASVVGELFSDNPEFIQSIIDAVPGGVKAIIEILND